MSTYSTGTITVKTTWSAANATRPRAKTRSFAVSAVTAAYPLVAFTGSLWMLARGSLIFYPLWIVVLAHATTYAGLLSHECMHNAVFVHAAHNRRLGVLLTWLSGASYFSFGLLQAQHLEHHKHHVGVDGFSARRWLAAQPRVAQAIIVALEWLYVPVLTVIINVRARAVPLLDAQHRHLAPRIAVVLAVRVAAFAALGWYRPAALAAYLAAHLLMIQLMRVYDCFHHTFEVYPRGAPVPKLPDDYLQKNTYSSLFSRRHGWTNAVFLNYGYHNAHHERPGAPWYELPALDREMFGESEAHCILMPDMLLYFHKNRIARLFKELGRPVVRGGRLHVEEYWGIIMNITFLGHSP